MKILKLIKGNHGNYFAIFDKVPELTYEKIGADYIGSAVGSNGDIISSHFLKKERFGDAFGGREIELKMKDGNTEIIKNYWFDQGSYKEHGEFVGIGAGIIEELQKCYVYFGYNINKNTFEKMIDEYLAREKLYEYREVEEWCKLQHKWYDVIVNNNTIPFMMNKYGEMVEKESKKRVYPRRNIARKVNGKYKEYTYFRFSYRNGDRLIKVESSYLDVLKNTLPYQEKEIKINCKIPAIGA